MHDVTQSSVISIPTFFGKDLNEEKLNTSIVLESQSLNQNIQEEKLSKNKTKSEKKNP